MSLLSKACSAYWAAINGFLLAAWAVGAAVIAGLSEAHPGELRGRLLEGVLLSIVIIVEAFIKSAVLLLGPAAEKAFEDILRWLMGWTVSHRQMNRSSKAATSISLRALAAAAAPTICLVYFYWLQDGFWKAAPRVLQHFKLVDTPEKTKTLMGEQEQLKASLASAKHALRQNNKKVAVLKSKLVAAAATVEAATAHSAKATEAAAQVQQQLQLSTAAAAAEAKGLKGNISELEGQVAALASALAAKEQELGQVKAQLPVAVERKDAAQQTEKPAKNRAVKSAAAAPPATPADAQAAATSVLQFLLPTSQHPNLHNWQQQVASDGVSATRSSSSSSKWSGSSRPAISNASSRRSSGASGWSNCPRPAELMRPAPVMAATSNLSVQKHFSTVNEAARVSVHGKQLQAEQHGRRWSNDLGRDSRHCRS